MLRAGEVGKIFRSLGKLIYNYFGVWGFARFGACPIDPFDRLSTPYELSRRTSIDLASDGTGFLGRIYENRHGTPIGIRSRC